MSSSDPATACESETVDEPVGWTEAGFDDDAAWEAATVFSATEVDPKDGYDDVAWDDRAQFIWGADLEVDNTVLLWTTVEAPA